MSGGAFVKAHKIVLLKKTPLTANSALAAPPLINVSDTVGIVYMQVIACGMAQTAALLAVPGSQGIVATYLLVVATMCKHIFVDGLQPPVPLMVMTGIGLLLNSVKPSIGKKFFLATSVFNAGLFFLKPMVPLVESFPDIASDADATRVGKLCFEVYGVYCLMNAFIVYTGRSQFGYAVSATMGLPLIAKHVIIDGVGPPPLLLLPYFAVVGLAWYENGFQNLTVAAEKAMQPVMKLHAMVCCSFILVHLLEGLGVSLPVMGSALLDSSYSLNSYTRMCQMMIATMLAVVAHQEFSGAMNGKTFVYYHYPLSILILLWSFSPTVTDVGRMLYMAPHFFTAWSTYIVVSKSNSVKQA